MVVHCAKLYLHHCFGIGGLRLLHGSHFGRLADGVQVLLKAILIDKDGKRNTKPYEKKGTSDLYVCLWGIDLHYPKRH